MVFLFKNHIFLCIVIYTTSPLYFILPTKPSSFNSCMSRSRDKYSTVPRCGKIISEDALFSRERKRVKRPACGSQGNWKSGTQNLPFGKTQRYVCRECGYKFPEKSSNKSLSKCPFLDSGAQRSHYPPTRLLRVQLWTKPKYSKQLI